MAFRLARLTPEMTISDDHYPATYIAGLYNTAASEVAGQVVENEDFVNAPDNQHIALKIGDATDWLTISPDTLQQLHRQLNLKTGVVCRRNDFERCGQSAN